MEENSGLSIDDKRKFVRFLILGSREQAWYTREIARLPNGAANSFVYLIGACGLEIVALIVKYGGTARVPENMPVVFALALCVKHGDVATRRAAYAAFPLVARHSPDFLTLVSFLDSMKGWSAGMRRACSKWYTDMPMEKLLEEVGKPCAVNGWTHRDVIRLAHPKTDNPELKGIFRWIEHPERYAGIQGGL